MLDQEQSDDVKPNDPRVPEVELEGPEVPEAEPDGPGVHEMEPDSLEVHEEEPGGGRCRPQEEREAAAEEEFHWAMVGLARGPRGVQAGGCSGWRTACRGRAGVV
eukprot:15290556-Heterocapsa_arctica.AAC.1